MPAMEFLVAIAMLYVVMYDVCVDRHIAIAIIYIMRVTPREWLPWLLWWKCGSPWKSNILFLGWSRAYANTRRYWQGWMKKMWRNRSIMCVHCGRSSSPRDHPTLQYCSWLFKWTFSAQPAVDTHGSIARCPINIASKPKMKESRWVGYAGERVHKSEHCERSGPYSRVDIQ